MRTVRLRQGSATYEVRIEDGAAVLDGRRVEFERREHDGRLVGISIGGQEHRIAAAADGDRTFVWCDGVTRTFEPVSKTRTAASRDPGGDLISPMPGRVRRILVSDGDTVARGQVLLVLEAMKMEHAIIAPRDGSVRLRVREGDLVDAGMELAEIG